MMFRLKTAFRYAFSKTRGQRTTSIMILAGIAIGLAALLGISSVMNGLQDSQLTQLRNLESFDLIVSSKILSKEDILKISGVSEAYEFIETNVLLVDKTSGNSTGSRVRGYKTEIFSSKRMSLSLKLLNPVPEPFDGLLISYSMKNALSLRFGDAVKVTFLKRGKTATIVPYSSNLDVDGFFSSRMTEFSSSTLFMDYDSLASIVGDEYSRLGIYADGNQKSVVNAILSLDSQADVITWQEYNRALYSALMLEKTLMFIFLAFMFLIICVNLKNSTRRLLFNKQKEGAMLRALGCRRKDINFIFLTQGVIVCILGEALRVILGILIIDNIQAILAVVDKLVRLFTGSGTVLAQIPFNAMIGNAEIAAVCLFVFALSLLFTAIGCRKIYKSEIMEVILNASY